MIRATLLGVGEHGRVGVLSDVLLSFVSPTKVDAFIFTILSNFHVVAVSSLEETSFAEANQQQRQKSDDLEVHVLSSLKDKQGDKASL